MKLSFRQGIVRHQKDTHGNQQFLLEQDAGIDLITENDPTTITFAHKDRNYVFVEKRSVSPAWVGPFASDGTNYWLYWDLDLVTGIRTFGHTTIEPLVGPTAPLPAAVDQHWFDTTTNTMKVFNGASYKERLRVFAAKYVGGTVIQSLSGGYQFEGSQVGLIQSADGGALIFDDADKPLKRGDGTFITTADKLASGIPNASNIKIEALQFTARASTNIAAYHIVYLNDFDSILPATPLKLHNVPFGIIEEDAYTGESVNVTTDGVICNPYWNWQEAGKELYIDYAGMITDELQPGMLPIGYVLSQSEILLKTSGVTQVNLEGGPSGAENLFQLSDVDVGDMGDGDALVYSTEDMKWINVPPISGPTSFENLDDTQFAALQDGDIVRYDMVTNQWRNIPLVIPSPSYALNDLTDVESTSPQYGMVLRYVPGIDGAPDQWMPTPEGGGASFIYELQDVSYDAEYATQGQILMFQEGDGFETFSEWVAVDPSQLEMRFDLFDATDVRPRIKDQFRWVGGDFNVSGQAQAWNHVPGVGYEFRVNATDADGKSVPIDDLFDGSRFHVMVNGLLFDRELEIATTGNHPNELLLVDSGLSLDPGDELRLTAVDMDTRLTPVKDEVLTFNGSQWVPQAMVITYTIDGATDTSITAPTDGHVLTYRSGQWVNEAPAAGVDELVLLNDVDVNSPAYGDVISYRPGLDGAPGVWYNKPAQAETVMTFNSTYGGGVTPILASREWNTVNCTQDTQLIFDFLGTESDDAVEFTLEIYPGAHAITWPAGIIGDTTLDANKMNIFTFVRRPAVNGLTERIYCMKVNIANDNISPLV